MRNSVTPFQARENKTTTGGSYKARASKLPLIWFISLCPGYVPRRQARLSYLRQSHQQLPFLDIVPWYQAPGYNFKHGSPTQNTFTSLKNVVLSTCNCEMKHYPNLSICHLPLQTPPARPVMLLSFHYLENSAITSTMPSSGPQFRRRHLRQAPWTAGRTTIPGEQTMASFTSAGQPRFSVLASCVATGRYRAR